MFEQFARQGCAGDELLFWVADARQVLIGGRDMRVRTEFCAQAPEEAGEVVVVAQPRVLGLGLSGGEVEVSAVEFV